MKDIFIEQGISYSLRHGNDVQIPKIQTTSFGVETIAHLRDKLWQFLPYEINNQTPFLFSKTN